MKHNYYVVYDSETLVPYSISGSMPAEIPAGMSKCKVREQDGEDFITFKKVMHNFKVHVVKGYAEFYSRWNETPYEKFAVPDNVLRDLSFRITFFINLKITFEYVANQLTLTFDLALLNSDVRNNFNTVINSKNAKCEIYVTRYQDATEPLEKFELDLYKLAKTKKQTFELSTDQPKISLWAIRKK